MLISRMHFPVTSLGWGRRVGIWTQGCTIGCARCIAHDTWVPNPSSDVPVAELLRVVAGCLPIDGVTISGGEPLDQADSLTRLLIGLRQLLEPSRSDILCYSGRGRRVVETQFGQIMNLADAIVTGPYVWTKAIGDRLRGSSNQEIVCLTKLGQDRYGPAAKTGQIDRLQIGLNGDQINTIGVPAPGVLAVLTATAAGVGLAFEETSWDFDGSCG